MTPELVGACAGSAGAGSVLQPAAEEEEEEEAIARAALALWVRRSDEPRSRMRHRNRKRRVVSRAVRRTSVGARRGGRKVGGRAAVRSVDVT